MKRLGTLIRLLVEDDRWLLAVVLLIALFWWLTAGAHETRRTVDERIVFEDDAPWICTEVAPRVLWCRPEGEFEI